MRHPTRFPAARLLATLAFLSALAFGAAGSAGANEGGRSWGSGNWRSGDGAWSGDSSASEDRVPVIVQALTGEASEDVLDGLRAGARVVRPLQTFAVIPAVAAEVTHEELDALLDRPDVVVTPDAPVAPASTPDFTLWPAAAGLEPLRADAAAPSGPAIAVVDSGVEPSALGWRLSARVGLASGEPLAVDDDNGHGTLVASIAAAGSSTRYPGAAPKARIVSLRVVRSDGSARTSDVIAAADWIYRNRIRYGIGVANFSLGSAFEAPAFHDPLAAAVRRLWLTGTVVVAAAGNDGPKQMLSAPASDPFVITVGAVGINGTADASDDTNAPWSSYGHTADGFAKPELAAPGRFMAGRVPQRSTLARTYPERALGHGHMWMSGTSFAAPVVAGAAAHLLARHPDWTPDDVKGALMLTARHLPAADPLSAGVGEIDAAAAAAVDDPPNPNENLYEFVRRDADGAPVFDASAWSAAVTADASWTSASWTSASWTSASWTSASWTSASWTSASWTSASWTSGGEEP